MGYRSTGVRNLDAMSNLRKSAVLLVGLALLGLLMLLPRILPGDPAGLRPSAGLPRVSGGEAARATPGRPAEQPVTAARSEAEIRGALKPAKSIKNLPDTGALDKVSMGFAGLGGGSPDSFVLRDRTVSARFARGGQITLAAGDDRRAQGPSSERRVRGVQWGLLGAKDAEPRAVNELPGRVNRFVGDPSQWSTDQKTYGTVNYEEIRPGVDLSVESRPHGYKYTLQAAPGADLTNLRFRYRGAENVRVQNDGASIEVSAGRAKFVEDGLVCYQDAPGGRQPVEARYVALDHESYEIVLGAYNPELPLTLDPVVSWSSYLGGTRTPGGDYDQAYGIAVDSSGFVYIGGTTYSPDFPVTGPDIVLGGSQDSFIIKLDLTTNPSTVKWCSFLGGSQYDNLTALTVDSAGDVYATGSTDSSDFPTTLGPAWQNGDVFVTKIKSDGTQVLYSRLLGGSNSEYANKIAVDSSFNAYVAGTTYSSDFPIVGGFDLTFKGNGDGFIVKLKNDAAVAWSTFLGGTDYDTIRSVAVDSAGSNVYVAGYTSSTDFHVLSGYRMFNTGNQDAFVAKIASGTSTATLTWSTYIGGSGYDYLEGMAIDTAGSVYITGTTYKYPGSTNFPTAGVPYSTTLTGDYTDHCFISKFLTGGGLSWSTYFGGNSTDHPMAIAVDGTNPIITGWTYSSNLPTFPLGPLPAAMAYDRTHNGGIDVFVSKFSSTGSTLTWSTFVGGGSDEYPNAIALDASANVYVTGYTYSGNFPTLPAPNPSNVPSTFRSTLSGYVDAFAFKLASNGQTLPWSTYLGGSTSVGSDAAQDVAVDSSGNVYVTGWTVCTDFPTAGTIPLANQFYKQYYDVFVTKYAFNAGTGAYTMAWSGYVGGLNNDDYPYAIAVEPAGSNTNVYLTGYTYSNDYPNSGTADGTYPSIYHGGSEVFVTKIVSTNAAPHTASLGYSRFIGGTNYEYGYGVAIDTFGNVYVTGSTGSLDFPNTTGVARGNYDDLFLTKLNSTGVIQYSTFLGGNDTDIGYSIKVDASQNAYVGGYTYSNDISGAGPKPGNYSAGLIAKFNVSGFPVFAKYLDGNDSDYIYDLALDGPGNIYVVGVTYSSDLTTVGAYRTTLTGGEDVFVAKLTNGGTLTWCTYLGGSNYEEAAKIRVDAAGTIFVNGHTSSFDFPTKNAFDSTHGGSYDVFVTRINSDGASLAWSSFLGGSSTEYALGLALGLNGSVIVVGRTYSSDFPVGGLGTVDLTLNGGDAFVTRIDNSNPFAPSGVGQFKTTAGTSIAVGGYTFENSFTVKAVLSDSDEDQVQLAVEVQPTSTPFTNVATVTSLLAAPSPTPVSLLVTPLPVGEYHWQYRTVDAVGKASAWFSFGSNSDALPAARDVGRETTAPVVSYSTPSTGAPYTTPSNPISVSGTITELTSGVASITWSYNGSAPVSLTPGTSWSIGSIFLSSTLPQPKTLTVTATDGAGNIGSTDLLITFDNTPPAVAITPTPAARTGASSIPVLGTASDNITVSSVTWTTDRGASGTATLSGGPINFTWNTNVALSPGNNVLTVTSKDGGNLTATANVSIFYDNVAPSLVIGSPAAGTIFSGPVGTTIPVTGTSTDPSSGTVSSIGYSNAASPPPAGGSYGPAPNWSANVPLAAGANPITITATDSVGNAAAAGVTVYLDTQNPAVTITVPTNLPTYTTGSSSITIGGTATDDLQVTAVTWVNNQGGSGSASTLTGPPNSKAWSALVSGLSSVADNVITVTVSDGVLPIPKTSTAQITIKYDTNAPAIIITNPPTANHVTPSMTIDVTGSATDQTPGFVNTVSVRNMTTGVDSVFTPTPATGSLVDFIAPVTLVIGDNLIRVIATDNTPLPTTVFLNVTRDPTAPAVTITGPTGADTYVSGVGTIALSGVASDNRGVTSVVFSRNPVLAGPPSFFQATLTGPPTACTWNVPSIPLVGGVPNIITVTATDDAGNTSTDTLTVTYDTTAPGITITSPTSAPILMTQVTPQPISGVASDVGSTLQSVTWSLTNASGNTSGTASITPSGGFFTWSAGSVALQPGANSFTVIATDAAGNTQSDSITIFLDVTKPTVVITSPASATSGSPGSTSTTAATVTLGGLAFDNIQLQSVDWSVTSTLNPAPPRTGTAVGLAFWSTLPISLDAGDNVIKITATDVAGNVSDDVFLTVKYDNSAPTLTILTPATASSSTTTTPATVDGTAGDNVAVTAVTWVNLTTGGFGTASGTDNWSALCPLTSGVNDIQVTAVDAAGNTTTKTRTITYDPAAPFITIVGPTTAISFTTGATPLTITATADDDIGVSTVTWTTDAAGVTPSGSATNIPGTNGWTAPIDLAPGSQVITFTATDAVFRTGTTRITIIYDPVNPQVTISAPSAQATYLSTATPIALGGIAIDNLALQDVKWVNAQTGENGTTQGVGVWTIPTVNLQQGPNVITVTATDSVGNTGSAIITVIYDGLAPTVGINQIDTDPIVPLVPLPAPPLSPYAPYVTTSRPLVISGTAGDNLNLTKVTWTNSLGGGGDATLTFTTPGTAATWAIDPVVPAGGNGVYFLPGDNIITVTAEDAHGQTTSTTITVQFTLEAGAPTINITSPTILTSATQLAALAGDAQDTVGVVSVTWRNMTTGVRGSAATLTGPVTNRGWTANVPLTNGPNVIVVTAADDAGNTTTATITLTYVATADVTTPSIDVVGPVLTDPWTTTPIPVTLDADDDTGIATIVWTNSKTGGAGVASYVGGTTWSVSIALGPGVNTLTFTAYDASGNSATDQLIVNFLNVSTDTTVPQVFIVPAPTGVVNTSVALLTLAGTANDSGGGSVAEVIWSNAATSGSASLEGTTAWTGPILLTPGLNLISITAYDDHGNSSAPAQVTVNYAPPAPVIPAGHCGLLGVEGVLLLALIRRLSRRR